ncbi:MAG TPA: IPT/TIG domain-containing protein [Chitinophagaceae bacterium]|nr:IPT/TIG domain-containing protein [Chitinophagaceae bacterium]
MRIRALYFFSLTLLLNVYDLVAQPIITSFTPQSGPVGTSITISGTNFSATPLSNIVFFGAVRANVTAATVSSLTVIVPAGATYQPISVTVNNLTGYSARPFILTFPGGSTIIQFPDNTNNTFAIPIDSTTDLHPNGVALIDFDGDGKSDIATPNNYSFIGQPASVSILRNTSVNGAISFASRQDITTGVQTYAIAAGDLDGDGKPDMISSSIVDRTISVFRNTSTIGTITFAPKVDYPTGDNSYSIVIADLNADGKPDVCFSNFLSNTFSVYRNTSTLGNISFAAKIDIPTDLGPDCLASGDMDGDGKTDISITNQFSNSVSVFRNTSSGSTISFAARVNFTTGDEPGGIATGDLDGDGKLDLAVANQNSLTYSVLRNTSNTGTVTFAARQDYNAGVTPLGVTIADVNGDGKPEIITAAFNNSISQNTSTVGSISFSPAVYLVTLFSANVFGAGDLSGDGKPDLAASCLATESVVFYRNKNNEPTVRSFNPTTAGSGATVTITGVNFTGASSVKFGGVSATSFNVVNSTTITAAVASGVSGAISVTGTYGTDSLDGFVYAGPPTISSFSPTLAATGTTVTINGFNFTGTTAVSFGGVAASSFSIVSPNIIEAVVGPGASGNVSVTTPYGTGNRGGFLILPSVSSFNPTSAGTGTTVTLTGYNFNGVTAVSFGSVQATSFNIVNATTITAIVAAGASGNISITNANGTTTIPGFIYIAPPTITSFIPSSAGTGTTVTISGTNFTNASSVKFGGTNATSFTVVNSTTITAVVASGTSGSVSVTTPGGTASLAGFVYVPPPTITSFTPTSTGTGGVVTIIGTNLSGATSVSFGGVAASSFNVVNSTTITAVVASGASGSVTVATPGGTANRTGFIFTLLTIINSFNPTSGPPGTIVTITGANFNPVAANNIVYVGGVQATVASANVSTLTITIPFGASFSPITVLAGGKLASSTLPFAVTFTGGGPFTSTSFAGRTDFVSGNNPRYLASGDIDGDGKPDIISANAGSSSFSVFKNLSTNGVLAFTLHKDFPTLENPYSVSIGDIDCDGKLDVVVLTGVSLFRACVFRNTTSNGIISFGPALELFVWHMPVNVVIEDLSRDGKPDLALTNENTTTAAGELFMITLQNTTVNNNISFDSPIMHIISGNVASYNEYPTRIAIGDMDDDGRKDLVIGFRHQVSRHVICIMRNTSNGNFISLSRIDITTTTTSQDRNLSVADLDGDGRLDIIGETASFRNNGGFSFTELLQNEALTASTIGDLNGNAKPDYTQIFPSPNVSIADNISSGANIVFSPRVSYTTGNNPVHVIVCDFDNDAKPEIATANYNDHRISILKNSFGYTGPSITSFTPVSGPAGTMVTITGVNFTGATAMSFGGVAATSFTVNSSTSITATVGAGSSGNVTVVTPSGTASRAWFTLIPVPPTITSFTPTIGGNGTSVTITGTNFSEVTVVSFGGTNASSFTVNSSTSITAIVASGTSGSVSVTTLGGTASLAGFTFVSAPTISSFTPTTAASGVIVTITGTNLTGATAVTFGGTPASSFTVVNATTITAVVGLGTSGNVTVTTPGGTASLSSFIFIAPPLPSITSFTPNNGAAGATITITGTNFTGATAVNFGGVAASSFIVVNSTTITAVIGTGATGSITVTTPGGTATATGFTFNSVTGIGGPGSINSNELIVNPNPARDFLIIKHPATNKNAELSFYDMLGRKVKTILPARNSRQTDVILNYMTPGIYTIVWSDGTRVLSRIIVIN